MKQQGELPERNAFKERKQILSVWTHQQDGTTSRKYQNETTWRNSKSSMSWHVWDNTMIDQAVTTWRIKSVLPIKYVVARGGPRDRYQNRTIRRAERNTKWSMSCCVWNHTMDWPGRDNLKQKRFQSSMSWKPQECLGKPWERFTGKLRERLETTRRNSKSSMSWHVWDHTMVDQAVTTWRIKSVFPIKYVVTRGGPPERNAVKERKQIFLCERTEPSVGN